jgi:hypothetical protein
MPHGVINQGDIVFRQQGPHLGRRRERDRQNGPAAAFVKMDEGWGARKQTNPARAVYRTIGCAHELQAEPAPAMVAIDADGIHNRKWEHFFPLHSLRRHDPQVSDQSSLVPAKHVLVARGDVLHEPFDLRLDRVGPMLRLQRSD